MSSFFFKRKIISNQFIWNMLKLFLFNGIQSVLIEVIFTFLCPSIAEYELICIIPSVPDVCFPFVQPLLAKRKTISKWKRRIVYIRFNVFICLYVRENTSKWTRIEEGKNFWTSIEKWKHCEKRSTNTTYICMCICVHTRVRVYILFIHGVVDDIEFVLVFVRVIK